MSLPEIAAKEEAVALLEDDWLPKLAAEQTRIRQRAAQRLRRQLLKVEVAQLDARLRACRAALANAPTS